MNKMKFGVVDGPCELATTISEVVGNSNVINVWNFYSEDEEGNPRNGTMYLSEGRIYTNVDNDKEVVEVDGWTPDEIKVYVINRMNGMKPVEFV